MLLHSFDVFDVDILFATWRCCCQQFLVVDSSQFFRWRFLFSTPWRCVHQYVHHYWRLFQTSTTNHDGGDFNQEYSSFRVWWKTSHVCPSSGANSKTSWSSSPGIFKSENNFSWWKCRWFSLIFKVQVVTEAGSSVGKYVCRCLVIWSCLVLVCSLVVGFVYGISALTYILPQGSDSAKTNKVSQQSHVRLVVSFVECWCDPDVSRLYLPATLLVSIQCPRPTFATSGVAKLSTTATDAQRLSSAQFNCLPFQCWMVLTSAMSSAMPISLLLLSAVRISWIRATEML